MGTNDPRFNDDLAAHDGGQVKMVINLAHSVGLSEPVQKLPGRVTPHLKNKHRNKPCPCGSGRKVKMCHGTKALR